ncbi:hypothetical protein AVEN_158497-1 [Araneus ventricosus]|uniref:Uncharacterized protein n=1 Tax=Araneus ventricosus TaxID=182803 RepID=A0A4Y2PEJ8_ARAVE|nr:hypothetical protein AVEN_240793-1 [Araneus ventricosus]GBN50385.1 hypothetical protein AVEN_158497-1 [Araneus ventricosus]
MSTAVRRGLTPVEKMRRRTRTSGLRNIRRSSLINPTLQELQYSTLRYIELAPKFEKSLLTCRECNVAELTQIPGSLKYKIALIQFT